METSTRNPRASDSLTTNSLTTSGSDHPFQWWIVILAIVGFLASGRVCLLYPAHQGYLPPTWIPTALGLAAVIRLPRSTSPYLFVGYFVAGLALGWTQKLPSTLPAELALWNVMEIAFGTWILKKFVPSPTSLTSESTIRTLLATALVMAPLGSILAGASLSIHQAGPFLEAAVEKWIGTCIGLALVLLPALSLGRQDWRQFMTKRNFLELAASLAITVGYNLVVLTHVALPLVYMALPLSLGALRRGFQYVTLLIWTSLATTFAIYTSGLLTPPPTLSRIGAVDLCAAGAMAAFIPLLIGLLVDQVKSKLQLLQGSESRFASILDSAATGFALLDPTGRILRTNPYLDRFLGKTPTSLIGSSWLDLVLPDDRAKFTSPHATQEPEQGIRLRFAPSAAPESELWGLAKTSILTGGEQFQLLQIEDVTVTVEAETALRSQLDSLARLGDIINGASEFSIIATDLTGTIRLFSRGAERMLGYSADDLIGKKTPAILHDPSEVAQRSKDIFDATGVEVAGFDVFVEEARRGESESRTWTYLRKDGSTLSVQLVVTPLHNHHGQVDGFLGVARDIHKEQEAIQAIEEARAQAEHASLMKSEFVANMSHEIRTPMNAVLGMVQLIGKTSITPNQRKYLDMIRKSGRSLLGILDDILDFSKIEAGQMRIEPQEFLLDDLLENISNITSVAASGKELEISIAVDPGVPSQLHGDAMRLQQVLVNLIVNAIKFTMHGEVTIQIEVLSTDSSTIRVGFRIRDTGIGMTEEQQRRLFHPFTQVDSSTTRRFGGTGLGLTIAKKLLDMMGGQIGVRSMAQIGTEFFVSIPFPRNQSSEQDIHSLTLRPLRLLVLEDHPASQTSLEASATRWGWKTEFATTLAQGIELLERKESLDPFDAVLVSANLPGWIDRVCIERFREICQREITVIKMVRTALENPADEGIRLLDGILVKPITSLSLLKSLKNHLGHSNNDEEESRLHNERMAEERKTLQGVRILLVEDNAFNQVVATETLQLLGAGVDLAENGKAAVDRLRRNPTGYDLVLMDVQMPVMDGYTSTRLIRTELNLNIPIVAMTAGVLPSDREKCMSAGMDDFITKPFEVDVLVRILRQRLSLGSEVAPTEPGSKQNRRKSTFAPDQLLQSLGGTAEARKTVRALVKQFLSTIPGSIRLGKDCIGRGDLEEATRAFHNMKSSSATLGALAFASLAHQLEMGLQESERKNLQPILERLQEEFDKVKLAAEAWLEAKGVDQMSDLPGNWLDSSPPA